jgi:hypothetical protein
MLPLLLIANKSSYLNAHTLFPHSHHLALSCGARMRFPDSSQLAGSARNAHVNFTRLICN